MKKLVNEFLLGLLAPYRGLRIIFSRPRVRLWAVFPFILTMVVLVFGGIYGVFSFWSLIPELALGILGWMGLAKATVLFVTLEVITVLFLWPVLVAGMVYLLFLFTRLIASPLYSFLAERALIELGSLAENPFRLTHWVRVTARMFWVSLWRTILFLFVGGVLFILSLVPVIGIFAAFGLLVIMAFDVMDYSFEALQMGLRARIRFFFDHPLIFFGFATVLGLVFLLPGLNFFLFPAAVVGGADVVRRLKESLNTVN